LLALFRSTNVATARPVAIGTLASNQTPVVGTVRHCTHCLAVYRTDFECCPHDGGSLQVSAADPLLGQVIADQYVLEGLIGEGAMGRVYRARHRKLDNQRYAIKILLGDLAAASNMRQRFEREARHAAKLDHPNVVNVLDFGRTANGLHYLVMDLVEGCSLASLIDEGPMSADRVIRIAHQLCEGLEHAHGRGVIHRDFKSENILVVGEPGREVARIADFGLAMSRHHEVRLTTSGVACTPAYAAPEQLRGGDIDHRVDLYGLGVTMFEMLSGGYLPFEGDLDTSIAAKLSHEAPSILTLAPNVPPGLVTIVSRLLAYEPSQRPRSARAVIRALETAMTLKRPAIRTTEIRPLGNDPRRRRWFKGAIIGITITAMAIAARVIDEDDVPLPRVPTAAAAGISSPPAR
jgi:serine/threonine-protein kinase